MEHHGGGALRCRKDVSLAQFFEAGPGQQEVVACGEKVGLDDRGCCTRFLNLELVDV